MLACVFVGGGERGDVGIFGCRLEGFGWCVGFPLGLAGVGKWEG